MNLNTKKRIDLALEARDALDILVSEVFTDYCKIYGIGKAYGVSSWSIGNQLYIVQDISCRGCENYNSYDLPLEYLYLNHKDRIQFMQTELNKIEERQKKAKHEQEIRAQKLKDKQEYEQYEYLKQKFAK
jgi:hypothetical protein